MDLTCATCGHESKTKQALQKHVDRKIKCTHPDHIKEIIEKPRRTSKCSWCEREFNDRSNRYKHQYICKKNPNPRPKIDDEPTTTGPNRFADLTKVIAEMDEMVQYLHMQSLKK